MKLEIKEYCIRCGLCEDLYPQLFRLNLTEDRIDLLHDQVPAELEDMARQAIRDCAIAAIHIKR